MGTLTEGTSEDGGMLGVVVVFSVSVVLSVLVNSFVDFPPAFMKGPFVPWMDDSSVVVCGDDADSCLLAEEKSGNNLDSACSSRLLLDRIEERESRFCLSCASFRRCHRKCVTCLLGKGKKRRPNENPICQQELHCSALLYFG